MLKPATDRLTDWEWSEKSTLELEEACLKKLQALSNQLPGTTCRLTDNHLINPAHLQPITQRKSERERDRKMSLN